MFPGCYWWCTIFSIVVLLLGASCLKNVILKIQPKTVQKGHSALLECNYDLENAPLYSLKFYRGIHEFYRYSPREIPTTKIFPFSGIQIDLRNSNSSQVTLSNIGFHLSGNFSCEVTTDAPSFSTAFVSEQMNVVVLPERHPIIRVEKQTYRSGETLQANCSSAASKPPTNLMFFLNSVAVRDAEIREEELENMLIRSDLAMTVKLVPQHYQNGNVVLKCMAIMGDFYQQSTELQVDFHLSDPIVEKIMYYNGESKSSSTYYTMYHTTESILFKLSTVMCIIVLSL